MALSQLEQSQSLNFNIQISRGPFFLKGSTKEQLDAWYASKGLPNDAPRWKVAALNKASWDAQDASMDALYTQAGISPRNIEATDGKIWTQTMTAHRLAQYAATESPAKGELIWTALSRRFFMGKDTEIRPIRLDSRELLMECATFAGLDLEKAAQVIDGGIVSEAEIYDAVDRVHAAGIHSIPVLVFEVEGMVKGAGDRVSWLSGARSQYRKIHHGSGNNGCQGMVKILQELHQACRERSC